MISNKFQSNIKFFNHLQTNFNNKLNILNFINFDKPCLKHAQHKRNNYKNHTNTDINRFI